MADLADLASVRRAAAEITAEHPVLHGLINNAGVSLGRRALTKDGQEMVFAVNFLAPFLLTQLLRPALEAGAPGRVINLATWRHPPVELDDLTRARRFEAQAVYGQSKTALVMFTQDLAKRAPGLRVNALNPGLLRTGLGTGLTGLNWLFIKVIAPLTMMKPVAFGAENVLRLAADPALADVSGAFFYEDKAAPPFQVEPSAAERERLWKLGAELTGLAPAMQS
jgi:NAD(P)-dependent dehydrogenase (short-subunit alcohol dehydrogenase family)